MCGNLVIYGGSSVPKGDVLQRTDSLIFELPQIDLALLPDLDSPVALHGTLADRDRLQCLDDNRALLVPCLYELHPGT
ncbi:hypothetical protein [Novosphingobium sp. RL4]|uniref:hypothetical protein n=1 Tax=Novosphingobium sp. RL4 TaxID=3109595 RepID=UPI002D79E3D2|nr:hypothetical protein [Novosphingobium sp. RL4]WRT93623.1 hypothetical protein U9J33_03690 [Novosphingobium sp. RL4]